MKTQDLDVVYSVKESKWNEELRYSLRSLKNLPHRNTWIFGGAPEWVNRETVRVVKVAQDKHNKWLNTAQGLKAICENPEVSDCFIWMNDDFFITRKIEEIGYYHDRTLCERIRDFSLVNPEKVNTPFSFWGRRNPYVQRLQRAHYTLNKEKLKSLNFELHVPMVFSKKHLLEIINTFPDIGAKRSLYGNTYVDPCIVEQVSDVKIWTKTGLPKRGKGTLPFLSTDDRSFADGEVGAWVRSKFKTKSIYEKDQK